MKIGLIDVDGHNYPNLPLMKISAWHKAKGDSVEWYQPMFSGHMDIVYMSKVFSFTPDYSYYVDADEIIRGGTGYAINLIDGKEYYDKTKDAPLIDEIEHIYPDYSLYPEQTGYGKDLKEQTAYGFLTRGCPRGCDFCHVAPKEGRCSIKVADLSEFWNGQKNIVLCDPNILACKEHMELLQQLAKSKANVDFNQGLDIRLVNDRNVELIRKIKVKQIHFAFDRFQDKDIIEPKLRLFKEKVNMGHKVSVYILVNFDTTLEQDLYRINLCKELNYNPYVMIYDKEHCEPVYKRLQRWTNSKVAFWAMDSFEEYDRSVKYEVENQLSLFDEKEV